MATQMNVCREIDLSVNKQNYPRLHMLYNIFEKGMFKVCNENIINRYVKEFLSAPKFFLFFVGEESNINMAQLEKYFGIESENVDVISQSKQYTYDEKDKEQDLTTLTAAIRSAWKFHPTVFIFLVNKPETVHIPKVLLDMGEDIIKNILFLKLSETVSRSEFYTFVKLFSAENTQANLHNIDMRSQIFHLLDKMFHGATSRILENWFYKRVGAFVQRVKQANLENDNVCEILANMSSHKEDLYEDCIGEKGFPENAHAIEIGNRHMQIENLNAKIQATRKIMADDVPYDIQIVLSRIPGIRSYSYDLCEQINIQIDDDVYDTKLQTTIDEVNISTRGYFGNITEDHIEKYGKPGRYIPYFGKFSSGSKINRSDRLFGTAAVFARDGNDIYVLTNDHVAPYGMKLYICKCNKQEKCPCADEFLGKSNHNFATHEASPMGGMVDVAGVLLDSCVDYDIHIGFMGKVFEIEAERHLDVTNHNCLTYDDSQMEGMSDMPLNREVGDEVCINPREEIATVKIKLFDGNFKHFTNTTVYKLGAVTSLTQGLYAGIQVITPLESVTQNEESLSVPSFGENPRRFDLVRDNHHQSFCTGGDSGSLIFFLDERDGTILAAFLLIGEYQHERNKDTTYLCCRLGESLLCLNHKYDVSFELCTNQ